MKYPHLLQGILDNKQIQDSAADGAWINITEERALRVLANGGGEHLRVKPDPKPNIMEFLLATVRDGKVKVTAQTEGYKSNIKLTFDGETGELIEAKQRGKPTPTKMEECLKVIYENGGINSQLARQALEP